MDFAPGNYINPGPWRIPYHHHGLLHHCKLLGAKLEPFIKINHKAYLHNTRAFGGKPQRFRDVLADTQGYVAELLGKSLQQNAFDQTLTKEDRERLLEALKAWGALNKDYRYVASDHTSDVRGYDVDTGGGLTPPAKPLKPYGIKNIINSGMWGQLNTGNPVRVPVRHHRARGRHGPDRQGLRPPALGHHAPEHQVQVGEPMSNAIAAVPNGALVKAGLESKHRFWEKDDLIDGGVTQTDLPIRNIC